MSTHSWKQHSWQEPDPNDTITADLFAAFGGIVVVLLLAALCAMGVPEIKASVHAQVKQNAASEKERADAAEESDANSKQALAGEMKKSDNLKNENVGLKREGATQKGRADAAEKDAEQARGEAGREREKRKEAEKDKRAMEGRLDPQPIDVIILIDGSYTQKHWMEALRMCIETLAEAGARVAPRFRLGIVVFRRDTIVYPLTVIGPTMNGVPSTGMRSMLSFTRDKTERVTFVNTNGGEHAGSETGAFIMQPKLSTILTTVDTERGVREALAMFDRAKTQKLLILISDVGPWEAGQQSVIEPAERRTAARITGMVKAFAGPDSGVLALFTGAQVPGLKLKEESRAFFKELAAAAGASGTYSEEPNQLAGIVLAESLKRRGVQ